MREARILPIKVSHDFLTNIVKLAHELPRIFHWLSFTVVEDEGFSIDFAYNHQRGQYNAEEILNELKRRKGFRVLGVTQVDLYVPSLNFVFGLAEYGGNAALISTNRLRPEFYGEPHDEKKFFERMIKEAVHELGHTFFLKHCPRSYCVMHFSNSIYETDAKKKEFCHVCKRELEEKIESIV
ncbi:MAG: archaemetzincin family Zn-dependent metalloprotease [Candidatus Jordarchaeales archaeon]